MPGKKKHTKKKAAPPAKEEERGLPDINPDGTMDDGGIIGPQLTSDPGEEVEEPEQEEKPVMTNPAKKKAPAKKKPAPSEAIDGPAKGMVRVEVMMNKVSMQGIDPGRHMFLRGEIIDITVEDFKRTDREFRQV